MSSFCTDEHYSPFALLDNDPPASLLEVVDCSSSSREEENQRMSHTKNNNTNTNTTTTKSTRRRRGGLTSKHLDPIASRNWKSVLSWITFHADEVSMLVDREGQSVLHHVCLFRAPLDIIDAILFSAPELAQQGNDQGELPLHWAVRLSLPTQVLALLLKAYSKSGLVQDHNGILPVMLLWDRFRTTLTDVYRIYGPEKVVSFSEWKLIMMMIESYYENNKDDYDDEYDVKNFPLHTIVQCPCSNDDLSFLKFSMELFSNEIQQKDSKGNLPLHSACSSSSTAADLIQVLLDAYPPAAFMMNKNGNLPLHLAIIAHNNSNSCRHNNNNRGWHQKGGVLKLIFYANPKAINYRDPDQHLYPFLLMAATTTTTTKEEEEEDNNNNNLLDTIYELLRANPEYVCTI